MSRKGKASKQTRPTMAIVVDGECEVWYFNMLKRNEKELGVNIEPKIPQKKSLNELFDMVKTLSKDYTKVFWVVDMDVLITETREAKKGYETAISKFNRIRETIKNKYKNVTIIVNNPCIEFWFLLHYIKTSKNFNDCGEAVKDLKKHLKDYEKTQVYYTKQDNDIYLRLKPILNTAIANAKSLGNYNNNNPEATISEMFKFFEKP